MKNLEALDQEPYLWEYLQTVQKPIVLYGMGNGADAILDRCAQLNIPVAGVFASDEFVRGQEFRGYKVKTYKEMQAEWGSFVILIAFASERPEILRRFFHLAEEQETYAPHLPLFGDTTVVTPSWIRENRGVLERVYGKLADDASRQVMEDILRYKLTGKLDFLFRTTDRRQDLETLFAFGETESYGDLGAYNGDTLREFLELTGGHYDHLYAVEPDPKNFAKLQHFVETEQLGRCRLAVAAKNGWQEDLSLPLRVATKYPRVAKEYYEAQGRQIEIIRLNGSIELAPILGLSDVIVDIVETGTTLKENDLGVFADVAQSSARLIANKASYQFSAGVIDGICGKLREKL